MPRFRVIAPAVVAVALAATFVRAQPRPDRVALTVDPTEAQLVLGMLDQRAAGRLPADSDWARLLASAPYRRLAERERSMGRAFDDGAFKTFVLSDSLLAARTQLRRTLQAWMARDLVPAAQGILPYLPAEARIRATVYPVIKPRTNSFVFDTKGNPAIFLYLDPAVPAPKYRNTVAHELHHIGFASVTRPEAAADSALAKGTRDALDWMSAFGEGFAMLAAAGGPRVHPHATSLPADRQRWDADMMHTDDDLAKVEAFLMDLIEGRIATEDEVNRRGMEFFGVQGPWYTLGYRMAATIERRYGRRVLIEAMRDPRVMVHRYNAAIAEENRRGAHHALWSARFVAAIGAG